jgi:hypothetical protein
METNNMETNNKVEKEQSETLAHVTPQKSDEEPTTYDPDQYLPKATRGEEYDKGVPLEDAKPDEGYSTDPAQGKESASLHLADEDMDRRLENPLEEARNLKESYEKSQKNSQEEKEK